MPKSSGDLRCTFPLISLIHLVYHDVFDYSDPDEALLNSVPEWLLHPLPANTWRREDLVKEVLLGPIHKSMLTVQSASPYSHYVPLANVVNARIWKDPERDSLLRRDLSYVRRHFTRRAQLRVYRHLVKDADTKVRSQVWKILRSQFVNEVSLPISDQGRWDISGWWHGLRPNLAALELPVDKDSPPMKARLKQFSFLRSKKGSFLSAPVSRAVEKVDLPKIETVGDLRQLLGLKSSRQLGWLLLASSPRLDKNDNPIMDPPRPYSVFHIPKRDKSLRKICAPGQTLRFVQRRILDRILSKVPPHRCAHGFVDGRSIVTNASEHVGKKIVIKFDLSNFFPSIFYNRVVGLFTSLGFPGHTSHFSTDDAARRVAGTLARLCIYAENEEQWMDGYCPQGAPTSPAISNLICRRLDARCEGLAEKFDGDYTRYADDLTFSFPSDDFDLGRFRWWVDQVCHQEGFRVNQKKYRVIRRSRRQTVTGIVVNDTLRVPREARRRFRAVLHDAKKNGIEVAARGRPGIAGWLHGFAAYLYMVHPEEGGPALAQVRELLGHNVDEAVEGTGKFVPGDPEKRRELETKIANKAPATPRSDESSREPGVTDIPKYWETEKGDHEMARIPAGVYLEGRFQVPRDTDSYSMARYPVTNEEWMEFINDSQYEPDSKHPRPETYLKHWEDGRPPKDLLYHPVTWISAVDALNYVQWADLCLPTERMWEKAARGLDGYALPWGMSITGVHNIAKVRPRLNPASGQEARSRNYRPKTTIVGAYEKTRTAFGCEQMVGNVSEWCLPNEPYILPPLDELLVGATMPVRGSNFLRRSGYACHHSRKLSAARRNQWTGFRVASMTK